VLRPEGGVFSVLPRLVVQDCRNGMTITRGAMLAAHPGERLDEGPVTWSGRHPGQDARAADVEQAGNAGPACAMIFRACFTVT
jgi:hypothetical protein